MTSLGALHSLSQYFGTRFSHEDGVLELRREFHVARAHGPSIRFIQASKATAGVDHRLDGETSTRQQALLPRLAIGYVRDVGRLVEVAAQTVADIFTNHRKTTLMRFSYDGVANHADCASGIESVNSQVQTVKRALRDCPRFVRNFADQECFRLIAVPTGDYRGYVDIDDVTFFELRIVRDAMTDNVIDARATAACVAHVAKRRRRVAMLERVFMDQPVDFGRCDAGLDKIADVVQDLGIETAGRAHAIASGFGQLKFAGLVVLKHLEWEELRAKKRTYRRAAHRRRPIIIKLVALKGVHIIRLLGR